MQKQINREKLGKLLELINDALDIYTSPCLPTNSLAMLRRLEEILGLAETNSFLLADPTYKMLAVPYTLMLISHIVHLGCSVSLHDPQSLVYFAESKQRQGEDLTVEELLALEAKKFLLEAKESIEKLLAQTT